MYKSGQNFPFSGKVIITALPPIETKDYNMEDLEKLMEQVRTTMLGTYHDTSKEIYESLNPNVAYKVT